MDSYLQAARNAASSILSQSTPRELDSAGFVSTSALDAALQSYTSQLLLATNATSGQVATSLKSSDQSLPNNDSADDFIRLGEPRLRKICLLHPPTQSHKSELQSKRC